MRTETEIKVEGMKVLIHAMGAVEAEQFVSAVLRERFDYTVWRTTGLPAGSINAIHHAAMQYAASKFEST